MRRTRTELKADLMKQAEELIEGLLDWTEETHAPNLTQIEDVVLALRKRIGEHAAQAVLAAQEQARPVPGPACPTCGAEMHYKDRKTHRVESRIGQLQVERGYYYCTGCERGLFPLGPTAAGVGETLE